MAKDIDVFLMMSPFFKSDGLFRCCELQRDGQEQTSGCDASGKFVVFVTAVLKGALRSAFFSRNSDWWVFLLRLGSPLPPRTPHHQSYVSRIVLSRKATMVAFGLELYGEAADQRQLLKKSQNLGAESCMEPVATR